MSSTNVIVSPDINQLIAEREQVWKNFDRAQSVGEEFRQLCSHIPNVPPANLQLPASPNDPPAYLATTVQQIKQELAAVQTLNGKIKSCHDQIETIKKNEKTTIALIIGGVVVALIVFFIVIAVLISAVANS